MMKGYAQNLAISCALESFMHQRIGCCIVGSGIKGALSRGTNHHLGFTAASHQCTSMRSRDIGHLWNDRVSYHAEMNAIENLLGPLGLAPEVRALVVQLRNFGRVSRRHASWRQRARQQVVSIYIARIRRCDGLPGNAHPCEECKLWFAACEIVGVHIKHIYHTVSEGGFIEMSGNETCRYKGHLYVC